MLTSLLPLLVVALLPASSNAQLLSSAISADPGATATLAETPCQPPFFDEGKVNTHQGKSLILKDVCLEQVSRSDAFEQGGVRHPISRLMGASGCMGDDVRGKLAPRATAEVGPP